MTAVIATQFSVKTASGNVVGDYRTAFLIVMPLALIGAGFLLEARKHIEADSAKIFEAVAAAMVAEQAEAAAHAERLGDPGDPPQAAASDPPPANPAPGGKGRAAGKS